MYIQTGHPDYNDIKGFDKQLYVVSCGFQHIKSKDITINRLNGREDYHILYITKGKGFFLLNNQEYIVEPGTVAFYNYGDGYKYTYYAKDAPCVYWLHFNGELAKVLLDELNFKESSLFKIGIDPILCEYFEHIIRELNYKPNMYFKSCCANLLNILTYISRKTNDLNKKSTHAKDFNYIISLMNEGENSHLQVQDYAKLCHLSKFRFIKNFKQYTGLTPIEYKNQIKINKAKWFLGNTDLSIAGISDLLGFESVSYFSTFFKKYMNVSPKTYRKNFNNVKY